jgi:hypothetical protein
MRRLTVQKPVRRISGINAEHQDDEHESEPDGEHDELREKRPGLISENGFGFRSGFVTGLRMVDQTDSIISVESGGDPTARNDDRRPPALVNSSMRLGLRRSRRTAPTLPTGSPTRICSRSKITRNSPRNRKM